MQLRVIRSRLDGAQRAMPKEHESDLQQPIPSHSASLQEYEELPKCSSAFDALYFCMTPGNQFKKYYREGTYDDCGDAQDMFFRV